MIGSFLIFLREGIEATMIVAILLAYLRQIGRTDRFRDVYLGVIAALALALTGGVVIYAAIKDTYDGSPLQTGFEGITYFAAVIVLTYMTFWMQRQSRQLKHALHSQVEAALAAGSGLALAGMAFLSVGREGLETVVFTVAIAFQSSPVQLAIGAVLGLGVALFIANMIYRLGQRINLRLFFNVMGSLLMLFAAGLTADGIQAFQELGWLPSFGQPVWNSGAVLGENTTVGDILHAFFGYSDSPSILQLGGYVLYLVVTLSFFLHVGQRLRRLVTPRREMTRPS